MARKCLSVVEDALDPISVAVEKGTEDRGLGRVRHRANLGPGSSGRHYRTQCVAVTGAIGEQDLPGLHAVEHVDHTAAVMRLSFGELDRDGQEMSRHFEKE